eukprot:5990075-Prymnesium_polylepis.1
MQPAPHNRHRKGGRTQTRPDRLFLARLRASVAARAAHRARRAARLDILRGELEERVAVAPAVLNVEQPQVARRVQLREDIGAAVVALRAQSVISHQSSAERRHRSDSSGPARAISHQSSVIS